MYFPPADSLSSFLESALKRLPAATEDEIKQVISTQFKYAPDTAHDVVAGATAEELNDREMEVEL